MHPLYLTEADVNLLIDMPTTIGVVEQSFLHLAEGRATNVPRNRAVGKGIMLHTMSAADDALGYVGWKAYTTTKFGARFLVGLYESATGKIAALIEADRLGQLRTGATTGVAVKHLANLDADRLGLFGTGTQARTQLEAIAAVRELKQVLVYGRDAERRRAFAQSIGEELQLDVTAVETPAEAVRDLPLVVTATTSREPVFDGNDLSPGCTLSAAGSNWLNKTELDATAVRRAARVVCDDFAACKHEAGDLHFAAQHGAFDWTHAVPLADVVAGRVAGRKNPDEIVLFKSVGLAAEDVAMAAELLKRAKEQGRGVELPMS